MKFKMLACALLGAGLCMQSVLAADQVINADLVVVGAGAGGTVAAASAAEGGLKTVLLEKNAVVGGNGIYMEGLMQWAAARRLFQAYRLFQSSGTGMRLQHDGEKISIASRPGQNRNWEYQAHFGRP